MAVFTYKDLDFHVHPTQTHGIQACYLFDNGFGVSVVKFPGSQGWLDGLYEMAVMKDRKMSTCNAISCDVLGYLTRKDVGEFMTQVSLLDPETGELPEGVCLYEQEGAESAEAAEEKMIGIRALIGSWDEDGDGDIKKIMKNMLEFINIPEKNKLIDIPEKNNNQFLS